MGLDEFKAWERKCLDQAVTNAVRLLAHYRPAAASAQTASAGASVEKRTQDAGVSSADAMPMSGATSA
jgi:hypothetical protein